METEKAVLGGGCFWCIEAFFNELKGVSKVTSGYAGGTTTNPSYDQIHTGKTGHAEVVEIEFDPTILSFETLLTVFFAAHDPTTLNRQGNDVGEEYRSIILYTSPQQEKAAIAKIAALNAEGVFGQPIVTQIQPLDKFYTAEEYHQKFFQNNPFSPYCQIVIAPKMAALRDKFKTLLKA